MTRHRKLQMPFTIVSILSGMGKTEVHEVSVNGKVVREVVAHKETWIYCRNKANYVYFRHLN